MKNKLKDIMFIAGMLACIIILVWLTGCTQRICNYEIIDPNGLVTGRFAYKSNFIATKVNADYIKVQTSNGVVVEFNRFSQDNDSIKVATPYGTLGTE